MNSSKKWVWVLKIRTFNYYPKTIFIIRYTECIIMVGNCKFRLNYPILLVYSMIFSEFICNGSGLQLSLVWWIRRSQNIRANRVPTVSKAFDCVRGEIFQRLIGFICLRKTIVYVITPHMGSCSCCLKINPISLNSIGLLSTLLV